MGDLQCAIGNAPCASRAMTDDTKAIDGLAATAAEDPFGLDPLHDIGAPPSPDARKPARNARTDEAAHRPLLHSIIRTRVFWEAKERLGIGGHDEAVRALSDARTLDRFKQSLYGGEEKRGPRPRRGSGRRPLTAPARWLVRQRLSMPGKLAFLEAVARSLGDDWSRDSRSFLDVTIAMGRLQLVLRQLVHAQGERGHAPQRGTALVTVPPAEAHHFAQCMIEELFRAEGWSTDLYWPESTGAIIDRIAERGHDIVCLSWSTGALAETARATIKAIESMPYATRPAVIAGGRASSEHQRWLVRLGVDCICESTYGALAAARQLLDTRASADGHSPPSLSALPAAP